MEESKIIFTVFFEDPFWIGVFEKYDKKKLSVCKVTFEAEPKDYDVFEFINNNYYKLKFSKSVKVSLKHNKENPKRKIREVKKNLDDSLGTKSQQALKKMQGDNKIERKEKSKEEKEQEKLIKYSLKKEKKKLKHKGR